MRRFLLLALSLALFAVPMPFAASAEPVDEIVDAAAGSGASLPGVVTGPLVTPGRETDPVVLTGADFPTWAAPAEATAMAPDASSQALLAAEGAPIDRLLAYRYDGGEFVQIPFQVDEVFTRSLSDDASGFSFSSTVDGHTTYAFDREGFRWTDSSTDDACRAAPASDVATDPVPGLDTLDELVFMARDAGGQAPADAQLPDGVDGAYEVAVVDPHRPDSPGFVYFALASEEGPRPAFDASNGYVRYERDAAGTCRTDELRQRRPGDEATVSTPRYRFRYEGRWLMTELRVSADAVGDWTYGADLVDRWKARAFQQRPGGETPCCRYEEGESDWGGSSQLLGELSGPVRTIRETWGADSGTHVVRRETFYRDEILQKTYLRVDPITPIDGIYAQWDHNAGAVETYYNPHVPDGVAIDGRNDDVFGNTYLHVDTDDPLFSGPDALLAWEQIAGREGTLVTRWTSEDLTPGGAAHVSFALPYYRDDACFDDGTGADPGPHLNPRSADDGEYALWADAEGQIHERECWDVDRHNTDPAYAGDLGTARFTQGSVGANGLHLVLVADSDNAGGTVPLTEISSEQRMIVLRPTPENVGERYERGFEEPLVATARPLDLTMPDPAAAQDTAPGDAVPAAVAEVVDAVDAIEVVDVVVQQVPGEAGVPDLPLPLAADVVSSLVEDASDVLALPASLKHELVTSRPARTWATTVEPVAEQRTTPIPGGSAAGGAAAGEHGPAATSDVARTVDAPAPAASTAPVAPQPQESSATRQVALVLASFGGSLGGALGLGVLVVLMLGRLRRREDGVG